MQADSATIDALLSQDPDSLASAVQERVRHLLDQRGHQLILFGTGELGRIALRKLQKIDKTPVAFADNKAALSGTQVRGVPVMSPAAAHEKYPQGIFVITVYTNAPVALQLQEAQIEYITFAELAWCYPDLFLPRVALELPRKIFSQAAEVRAAFGLWGDEISRREYVGQLSWRCTLDRAALPPHQPPTETYFPPDLFELKEDEVFVDCGAFDGDTMRAFLQRNPVSFGRLIGLEPDEKNRDRFETWRTQLPKAQSGKIELLPFAAGKKREKLSFDTSGEVTSAVGVGSTSIDAAPLDELLPDAAPTFIKMDIEGSEPEALLGARRMIQEHQPILAICAYHVQEHLWTIPLLIHALNPEYRLFLRRYSDECWELMCYAVPANRCKT